MYRVTHPVDKIDILDFSVAIVISFYKMLHKNDRYFIFSDAQHVYYQDRKIYQYN